MSQGRAPGLPSFSGLSSAVNEAREYENSKRAGAGGGGRGGRNRQTSGSSETSGDAFERNDVSGGGGGGGGGGKAKPSFAHGSAALLLQDTLTPLLDEVDALFEESKRIVGGMKAQSNQMQDDDVEVEIMERMAEAWQSIEAKNARHDTSHKLNREKPMFCMDSLGKRIKAALLCKILPKGDNPAEYVNGADNAPSRNLVTAIKLAGYVVHSGTGGKVSAVDGDGREPPSKYTKEEFHNNVLPRAAENQPPRILNELRQLSCRLVASGIAKGLLLEEDLPQIRKTLVSRFQDGGMHFLGGGEMAFARFMRVAADAHRLLERGDIDDFVLFHERVVKLVGMCRNRVRRAAYATSKNMLAQTDGTGRYVVVKSNSSRRMPGSHPSSAAAPAPSPSAPGWRNGDSSITPAPAARPQAPLSGQPSYETPASAYGKPLDTGFNNGNAIVRAAMSMLPVDNMPAQGANQRAPVGLPQGPDAGNATPAPFHDQLSAAAPEILTQMGYRRAPAYGPEGAWGNGSAVRGQDPAARVESPPVLVLQPGWGVTLPPYFLGMTDAKRPRNVPVKMLWELSAEALVGNPELVLVEMRQVPGYLDFLAEIMPPDMLKFRWARRCWETLQGKNDTRTLLDEAAAALHHLGLVPMPPGSNLRTAYDDIVSHKRSGDATPSHGQVGSSPAVSNTEGARSEGAPMHPASLGVPPVAAGVLRDLHREGALNGEALNVWGDGGGAVSPELQRALTAAAATPAAEPGALDIPAVEGIGSTNGVAGGGGGPVPGQWAPPTAPGVGAGAAKGSGTGSGNGSGNGNANGSGKRKAGSAFPESALPEAGGDW